MRIGMFVKLLHPVQGGIETSVINLKNGLEAAGHQVFIFCPNYPGWEEKDPKVYRYKSFAFTYEGYQYVIPLPRLSKMDEVVAGLNLDVIHSHGPYSLGWEATKLGAVCTSGGGHLPHQIRRLFPLRVRIPKQLSKKIIRWFVNRNCLKCDAIIAPSSAIKKLLFDQGIKKSVFVVPSGINIDQFAADQGKREELRRKYGVKNNEVLLITASRVVPEKNIDFLVRAFALIHERKKSAKLMIVGDGSYRDELEALVKELSLGESVVFTGLLDKEGMIAHYQASDIFTFASLTETQGWWRWRPWRPGCRWWR
jgi:glycosyltransferase involved in cell wall biosynthesis